MSLVIAAAVLPLLSIGSDDVRLQTKRTFVSEEARIELVQDNGERVLCLDRKREGSICLTEVQWRKAIALAEAEPQGGRRARAFIPNDLNNLGLNAPTGLSAFATR